MGLRVDYKKIYLDLKEQVYYEKNGRFAKEYVHESSYLTSDHSSMMEMYNKNGPKALELYQEFELREKQTEITSLVIS